jgi:YD repeat-containing protein
MTVAGQPQITYTYDNANRLTQIVQGTSTVGFSYDTANRRSTLTLSNGVNVSYSYDNDSRVTGNHLQIQRQYAGQSHVLL